MAFQRKGARFLIFSKWDLMTYGDIIHKMGSLGNIQFRQITIPFNYYLCSRDSNEWLIGKIGESENELIAIYNQNENEFKVIVELTSSFSEFSKPIGINQARQEAKMAKNLAKKEALESKIALKNRIAEDKIKVREAKIALKKQKVDEKIKAKEAKKKMQEEKKQEKMYK